MPFDLILKETGKTTDAGSTIIDAPKAVDMAANQASSFDRGTGEGTGQGTGNKDTSTTSAATGSAVALSSLTVAGFFLAL